MTCKNCKYFGLSFYDNPCDICCCNQCVPWSFCSRMNFFTPLRKHNYHKRTLYESEGVLNMTTDVMKWMEQAIQTIQSGIADKLTKDNITIYRVKNIIRIDIKGEVQIAK